MGDRPATSFAERVRDSCIAVGIGSSEELIARGKRAGYALTVERLNEILAQPETMLASELLPLAELLGVRVRWLADGTGPATPVTTSEEAEHALRVLDLLSTEKKARWIDIGEYLSRH